MWLREITIGGLMFSPFPLFLIFGLMLTGLCALVVRNSRLQQYIWRDAWFFLSLWVCLSALSVYLFGAR